MATAYIRNINYSYLHMQTIYTKFYTIVAIIFSTVQFWINNFRREEGYNLFHN